MTEPLRRACAALALGLLAACASTAPPAAQGSVKDQMKLVVEPASNLLFAVQGEVDPANGAPPAPAGRWTAAVNAAAQLKGVAVAMMQPGHAVDGGDWMRLSREMGVAADQASAAARARDGAAFSDAVNAMSDNCGACHGKYKSQTG